MKKLKELFSDTLVYGISSVLARFINYLLVPFYTDKFPADQYGVVGLIYAAIIFLNVLFTFGMESAYLRYAKDRDQARDVFKTIQTALLLAASVLAVLLWVFAPTLMPLISLGPETKNFYLLMIGILWFDTLGKVPFAELRLVQKSITFAIIRMTDVLLNIGLNFYFILGLGWGIEAVFIANLIASAVTTVILWMLTANMLKGTIKKSFIDKALVFGLPFVPGGLGYAINESLDRFLLNTYLPLDTIHQLYGSEFTHESVVGIYNACYKLGVFMLLVVQMFKMAWQPFFLRHADDPEAKDIYRDVFRYFNGIAGICFLTIALFVDQIVQIKIPVLDAYIIGKEYWLGLNVVPFLLVAYWFQGWYMNFSAGIFIREKTKVLPVITLMGAGVTVATNLLLLPYFGMVGAAAATLVSYAAMALMLYYQSVKAYQVDYQIGRAFGMVLLTVVCLFLQPYLNQWIASEWISRIIMLLLGVVGLILFSLPTSKK